MNQKPCQRGAEGRGREAGRQAEQPGLGEVLHEQLPNRHAEAAQYGEFTFAFESKRHERTEDAEKRDDTGQQPQHFRHLKRSVEDNERDFADELGRADAQIAIASE